MMKYFWDGFEKRAYGKEDNLKELETDGNKWESSGMKKRWGYLGVPAAIAGGVMTKNPLLRAGAAVAGIGSGLVGYAGERQLSYGKGLKTIAKHIRGENPTKQEWDQLIMNNPSGSLITHVHPEHRAGLVKRWSEEYKRFHEGQ